MRSAAGAWHEGNPGMEELASRFTDGRLQTADNGRNPKANVRGGSV